MLQPTNAPACAERKRDLRPVRRSIRTEAVADGTEMLALLGRHISDRLARVNQRTLADEILDLPLGLFVQRVIGGARMSVNSVSSPREGRFAPIAESTSPELDGTNCRSATDSSRA